MANRFDDLRVLGVAVTAWLLVWAALLVLWLPLPSEPVWARPMAAAPALLAAALTLTGQRDRGQYVARLLACGLMLPVLQLIVLTDGADMARGWRLATLAAAHVGALVLATVLLARRTGAIGPAPGIAPVDADRLRERLRSLAGLGLPLRLVGDGATGGGPDQGAAPAGSTVELELLAGPGRRHRVQLRLDAAAQRVQVIERLGARDAAPATAGEASMRALGEPAFDPARPSARRVAGRVAQVTVVEPGPLAAVRLHWSPDGRGVAAAEPGGDDAQALVTLIAALVTRSGWSWAPRMFGAR